MTRKSDYKKQYDDQVIEWLAEGKTLYCFGKELGVGTSTLYDWKNNHASFSEAIKKGRELSKEWGMQFVADAVRDNTVQSVPFIMYCRNFLNLKTKDDNKQDSDMDALKEAIGSQVIKQFILPKNGRDDPTDN
jgi:hypothetical protein